LYWLIRKIVIIHDDADDVLQNTLIKVWKALPGFKGDSAVYTWLYRIAVNESVTYLNRKKKESHQGFEEYENYLSNTLQTDSFFDGDALQLKLQQAILTLPEKQRIVFNMRYFEETSYRDMSEILDTSEGALKASYHHAVKKIEAIFDVD
jgi:RNA polymerase sigma-70 factor (ECF subfamily)